MLVVLHDDKLVWVASPLLHSPSLSLQASKDEDNDDGSSNDDEDEDASSFGDEEMIAS